ADTGCGRRGRAVDESCRRTLRVIGPAQRRLPCYRGEGAAARRALADRVDSGPRRPRRATSHARNAYSAIATGGIARYGQIPTRPAWSEATGRVHPTSVDWTPRVTVTCSVQS